MSRLLIDGLINFRNGAKFPTKNPGSGEYARSTRLETCFTNIISDYSKEDIYNLDETTLL